MKCRACDAILTDFESSARSTRTGDYLDMCNSCLAPIRHLLDTSENFILYDPSVDDLTTAFERVNDVAISGSEFDDDAAAAVDGDGERLSNKRNGRSDEV